MMQRRTFITGALAATATIAAGGCAALSAGRDDSIIDIHQHTKYGGRSEEELIAHQRNMGVARTILLPSGRAMRTASTHHGEANGLQAAAGGNESCFEMARKFPRLFYFAANEVPDATDAERQIEKYLKLGGVAIAEQKFAVECDSPAMQRLYRMAADYNVPILMHWEHGRFNYGFERFHSMLAKHPRTIFIGHAQTWWANIGKEHENQAVLYPKANVEPGGLTDRYLSDYPNMFGDLSAGSGLNSLTRDEEHAREFLRRHQDKLLYGSDCNDKAGSGSACLGWRIIHAVRKLAPDEGIRRKIFRANARKVFRL